MLDEIEEFLTGARRAPESDRVLTTVLFTDIVGSTERAARSAIARWRELAGRTTTSSCARELDRYRGREIKTTGRRLPGHLRRPRARDPLCPRDRGRGAALGIDLRAGLHTGECELVGDDIGGIAVHIGARIGALAGADEVLVSSTVKDLVAGSGISFEPGGPHRLRGIPDEWPLYAAIG